ncbi:MAG: porin family protein [Pseudomonadota bacterium]
MPAFRPTLLLIAALCGASACASAADTVPPASSASPFYLGIGLGKSSVSSKVVEEASDPSFDIHAGYQINENLALEAFARSLSFRIGILDAIGRDHNFYPDHHVGLAMVGSLPLAERFKAYGRLGLGRTTETNANDAERAESDISVGVGVSYAFTRHVAMTGEITRFTNSGVTTALLGMNFNF